MTAAFPDRGWWPLAFLGVAVVLAIIMIANPVVAFTIVLLFRHPASTALTISASLAQIGEFSFIIAAMGTAFHILPDAGGNLILAGALISIVLNPLSFFVADRLRPRVEARVAARRGEPLPEAAAAAPVEPRLEPAPETPEEAEAEANAFYEGLLGIPEVPKPPHLAARGGCWFERDALKVHLGVEADFRPATKAHPALLVEDVRALAAKLVVCGLAIVIIDCSFAKLRFFRIAEFIGGAFLLAWLGIAMSYVIGA